MQFTKLRLSGFKSFVDPTEVLVEPGLTGIVGPNGCGKSNLVEALRWVMGEISAKQLRGGEMDDVIFGGSANRPGRNLAEVIVLLDNSERHAPAIFNEHDELEVCRRIERGEGSTYLVNGREVRARDVQLLFADAAIGSRSPALVSQGQIGALINAKPSERRALLEEAAGIIGLHSRRHEAELRLRAAESNLARLDDVLTTLDAQLQGIKRQARQANRYRRISEDIRRIEATLLYLRWSAAGGEMETARAALAEAERRVVELTRITGGISGEQAEAAAALPDLRRAEAEAAAALQRLTLGRESLDTEETRLEAARAEIESRLVQIAGDIQREHALAADAGAALERIEEERERIAAAQSGEAAAEAAAAAEVEAAAAEVGALETKVTDLTAQAAAEEERRVALVRRLTEVEGRLARLMEREQELERQRAAHAEDAVDPGALESAERALADAGSRVDAARDEAAAAESARAETETVEAEGRAALHAAEEARAKLRAEAAALSELLAAHAPETGAPVVDRIRVEPGYEAALGAALGDDLEASADTGAPVHWETLPPYPSPPPLPEGAEPLSRFIAAPDALARRLTQVGVVDDAGAGRALQHRLVPGQRLVSRDGALWRWDGFTAAAGTSAAATRLHQRKRLAAAKGEIDEADRRVADATARFREATAKTEEAKGRERAAREALHQAYGALNAAREVHTDLARRAAAHGSRLAALEESVESLKADRAEAEAEGRALRETQASLPELEAGREALARLRSDLAERRAALAEKQNAHDRLRREAAARRQRLAELEAETRSWQERAAGARQRLGELERRQADARGEVERLKTRPAEIAVQRHALGDRIEAAEAERRRAADRLAETETRLAEIERRLKAEEARLVEAREERVRREAMVTQAERGREDIAERIRERFEASPEDVLAAVGVDPGKELPAPEALQARLERLARERDNMGPVNLRAESEAAELMEQIETLNSERGDLVSAIAKLRQGIAGLNREGRERLLAAFEAVDRHFRELFVRLFGGGRAYMKLVESEDPLEAGLEIFASPPGKRLQVLSLLSGGEQALTALALLFAVFLTNPAPICVLDEVDAPLDDANVERFCDLLEEIARNSATRFLLVTHHRLTMARMDRLFGVTMVERGISQLVSVDLQSAEQLRATA